MPTTYHSGSLHNAHHLPLRLTPQCPPPTTQAHSTVDTQHLSLRPNPSPPPVTQDIQHLSLRPNPSPPPVTQAQPITATSHSGSPLSGYPASVTQAQPITATCHSGSPHSGYPASVTQAQPITTTYHLGPTHHHHLSLRPNPSPPPVTQAHPTMPSTLHSAISILAYLHLVRLTGRLSLVLEKDPAQMSCHLLKYVSTVLSSLWGIMFCGWGHYVSHCVMRMWRGCPPCHLAVSQG